jgi:hypothetical protein
MHLDQSLAQADAVGENTSRKELAPTIVASTKLQTLSSASFSGGTEGLESEICSV